MNSEFFRKRLRSFSYAFSGIAELWRNEKNTRIHLFFTFAAIAAGLLLKISPAEFVAVILIIGAVWSAEAMNSAVERTVDLVTGERKPLAKAAKDLAAGAVLILAVTSVIVGMVIFLPKIIALFVY